VKGSACDRCGVASRSGIPAQQGASQKNAPTDTDHAATMKFLLGCDGRHARRGVLALCERGFTFLLSSLV